MPQVLTRPQKLQPGGSMDSGVREGEGGMRTEREAVRLVDVEPPVGGTAEEVHGGEGDREVVHRKDMQHRVVCMLVARRRGDATRQGDGADGAGALEVEEIGGEGLAAQVIDEGGEGAALGDAGKDSKHTRAESVVQNLSTRAGEEHRDPPPAALTEPVVLKAAVQPRTVHPVVRLLEVEEREAPLAAVTGGRLLEPVHLLEVKQHVVRDVSAWDEGRLCDGQDVVGRAAHA